MQFEEGFIKVFEPEKMNIGWEEEGGGGGVFGSTSDEINESGSQDKLTSSSSPLKTKSRDWGNSKGIINSTTFDCRTSCWRETAIRILELWRRNFKAVGKMEAVEDSRGFEDVRSREVIVDWESVCGGGWEGEWKIYRRTDNLLILTSDNVSLSIF